MRLIVAGLLASFSLLALAQEEPSPAMSPEQALAEGGAGNGAASLPSPETKADIAGPVSDAPHNGVQSMYRLVLRPGALNRLTFDQPFVDLVLSPDVPLASEPLKMRNNQTIVLEFTAKARGDYQAIATLVDGSLVELILRADPEAPPLSWTQPSTAAFGESDPANRQPIQRREDAWFKDLFHTLVSGEQPEDFVRVPAPKGGQLGNLRADYLAAFRNEDYVVLVAKLYSRKPGWIAEQDFYVPGVKAVLLDGQRVGEAEPPVVYIVMAAE